MQTLNFETGVVEYAVGDAAVAFNPTDMRFVERVFDCFDKLDQWQEKTREEIEAAVDNAEVFACAKRLETAMRSAIDEAFGQEVCTQVFGDMSVYALSGGLPLWCNLLLAVLDEVDSAFAREQKKTDPRIKKYLAKYEKKRR